MTDDRETRALEAANKAWSTSSIGWRIGDMRAAIAAYNAVMREPSPEEVAKSEQARCLETAAERIYNTWKDVEGWVPWVPGGNSDKQNEARRAAGSRGALL